ncbi:MAG: ABC transporter substrate-binding protein [Candidatus Omnitrophica bacterium]|nr:ABC transporter substrate-binding protein [Candidatus Omnitrophota bacterium]
MECGFRTALRGVFFVFLFIMSISCHTYAATVALVTNVDNSEYQVSRETFAQSLKEDAARSNLSIDFITIDSKGNKEDFISQLKNIEKTADLFFVAGTPNAMLVKEAGITKPVIFAAVADPVGAKLVNQLDYSGTNFTGVQCSVPEDRQIKALLLALPSIKRVGLLYTPGDPAPASQAKKWKDVLSSKGITVHEVFIPDTLASSDELSALTAQFAGKVDVIVTTADSKVVSFGDGMIKVANENRIPTYAGVIALVKKGALMCLGFDFPEGAKVAVPMAREILGGRNPMTMPVGAYPKYKLVLNIKTAQQLKVEIPPETLKLASEVIKD